MVLILFFWLLGLCVSRSFLSKVWFFLCMFQVVCFFRCVFSFFLCCCMVWLSCLRVVVLSNCWVCGNSLFFFFSMWCLRSFLSILIWLVNCMVFGWVCLRLGRIREFIVWCFFLVLQYIFSFFLLLFFLIVGQKMFFSMVVCSISFSFSLFSSLLCFFSVCLVVLLSLLSSFFMVLWLWISNLMVFMVVFYWFVI